MEAVRFSSVLLGNKHIRFIYVRQPDLFYVGTRAREEDVPLFLGADVLSCSSVSTKNHGRVHARFSKDKVATKVNIKGVQVEGINHSSYLWFYNVQGLFRVAFEYLQEQQQHDCLLHLKDLWMETLSQSELQQEICLSYWKNSLLDLSAAAPLHRSVPEDAIENDGMERVLATPASEEATSIDNFVELTDGCATGGTNVLQLSIEGQPTETSYGSVVFLDVPPDVPDVEVRVSPSKNETLSQNADHLHSENGLNIYQIYCCVSSFLREQQLRVSKAERHLLRKFDIVLQFFKSEYIDNEHGNTGLPIELLENYVTLLSDTTTPRNWEDTFDIPKRTHVALCVVCEWLGKELHNFSKDISEKVETFKLKNIDSISSLPSPQFLVESLFPACMKILMVNWMGQQGLGHSQNDSASDHDYSPPSKKQTLTISCKQLGNTFPFVQLILEFANNVLISGVAHVLYSRLLQDGSC